MEGKGKRWECKCEEDITILVRVWTCLCVRALETWKRVRR